MFLSLREQRRLNAKTLRRTKKTKAKCIPGSRKNGKRPALFLPEAALQNNARICLNLSSKQQGQKILFNNKTKQKPNSTGKVEAEKGSSY